MQGVTGDYGNSNGVINIVDALLIAQEGGYPNDPMTTRSITVLDGVQARQDWLDAPEDEIAVDTELDLSRLYNLIGPEKSDIYRP